MFVVNQLLCFFFSFFGVPFVFHYPAKKEEYIFLLGSDLSSRVDTYPIFEPEVSGSQVLKPVP